MQMCHSLHDRHTTEGKAKDTRYWSNFNHTHREIIELSMNTGPRYLIASFSPVTEHVCGEIDGWSRVV